ncbi:MAG: cytochrome c-type biogenesis protein [Nevskiales bacterium]
MSRQLPVCLLTGLLLIWAGSGYAQDPNNQLSETQQARYITLIAELRCLVCQNQNIADSNAPLAQDLRSQVHSMIAAGKSNAEIKAYLVERYGDFVLYRPPIKPSTWLLWGSPFLLLLLGLVIAWRIAAARRTDETLHNAPDNAALARALNEEESP